MANTPNVIIDPVTRIEGHLRIQAYAESNGKGGYEIKKPALSSSTMVRGIEKILQGRDPRDAWAFTQRICGVCTVVHGLTSVRAVENAIGVKVPKNADYIRNMMIGAQYVHDHVMHFYHLHALDWVDVKSALEANPNLTAELSRANNPNYRPNNGALPNATYFQNILNQLNSGLVSRGQLGLFANGYWELEGGRKHPAYKLSSEENLLLVSHYLEALGWAREIVKLHTIFGGKDPHPNLVVGGMPCTLSSNPGPVSEDRGGTSLNTAGFTIIQNAIAKMKAFADQVYLPDVVLVANRYKEWADYGATEGNFLCFGDFPDPTKVREEFKDGAIDYPAGYLFPTGVLWKENLDALVPFDESEVTENVAHAWYSGPDAGVHPSLGTTELNYTGPKPDQPGYMLNEYDRYSWIKSPRYQGQPMEVGPLAHILMMHARNTLNTDQQARSYVQQYWTGALGLGFGKLNSTLGRIFCRMLETKLIADQMDVWYQEYYANKAGAYWNPDAFSRLAQPASLPEKVGFGFTEAPRGALGHWVSIDRTTGMINNYQCVVASQWNAGPRDANGVEGPYERALVGHTLVDVTKPVEVLRTIHSFDPCIGCAVHIADADGQPLVHLNVSHAFRSI